MMPRCYQLVGVSGSGKTTWAESQYWASDCVYVSTDAFVERFARRMNKSYSDIFVDVMPRCIRLMMRQVIKAREERRDVIWDQTSTSVESRIRKFSVLPDYEHIAVVFATPSSSKLFRRLASRPGKTVPWNVVSAMINNFEMPTEKEGFKEIWKT